MALINYWHCVYNDYDECWDGEEECRIYGCKHPNGDGCCDLENKFCGMEDECKLIDAPQLQEKEDD